MEYKIHIKLEIKGPFTMKILLISGTFPPRRFGGITAVSFIIAKKIVQKGHDVTVFTTDVGNDSKTRLDVKRTKEIEGIKVRYFPNLINSIAFNHRIYLPIGYYSQVKKSITEFDIIHIHDYRSLLSLICSHFARKANIPYIVQTHGDLVFPDSISTKLNFIDFLKKMGKLLFDIIWGKKILENAAALIAVSQFEAEQFKVFGNSTKGKVFVVPNGIILENYNHLPIRGEFRRALNLKSDEKVVLYLGRINKLKGIDFLIRAYSEVVKQNISSHLVIVGPDDGYKNDLLQIINTLSLTRNVIFTGLVSDSSKLQALVDADVVVYPSKYEIFGLVPFEAVMCGTPVIVTKSCGCGEMVAKAECGFLVDYGNTEDLVKYIGLLLQKPDIREHFINNGRRYIIATLDWDIIIETVLDLYRKNL